MTTPIIGITTNLGDAGAQLARGYWQSVRQAGGVPVLIPPTDNADEQEALLEQLDGLVISGGADLNPLLVGEDPIPELHGICPERDAFELRLCRRAHDRQIPIFGICRGIQVMAAALGGKVCQDIGRWQRQNGRELSIKHSQDAPRDCLTHRVRCVRRDEDATVSISADAACAATGSAFVSPWLAETFGEVFPVNSFHHQAATAPGPHMEVTAVSADGVIEAMQQREGESFLLGVQWHPECLPQTMGPLFRHFVEAALSYGRTLEAHNRICTLDSHCDTPMFFDALLGQKAAEKGVSIADLTPEDEAEALCLQHRNATVLVDAEKMNDGHLDETYMVSYIPQGPRTPEGFDAARRQVEETYRRLDVMIAATEDFEDANNPASAGIAIHRGIENGYAIGRDLTLLKHYQDLGCEYVTLCHNGHNDICDSARPLKAGSRCDGTYPATDEPATEHGGLSAFGREVVKEMNRIGLLIDLSHAAETTFYDVLDLSMKPVAVTHACSRAICDHPRNLTDDQLRAIAAKGGVVQCTMYPGFLAPDGENPTLHTFMRHLEHMIEVCGIDHVGIGSDFDGDGGVPGLDHAGCMVNITRCLLERGYSEDDICKIWGDNFRRVLAAQ
ncbi:MAG: gamma-glutamyl-gamma-aminobutyrate hydrolase family protein [Bacteroidales bacterium]|nr:gamma-glutamyl-gamma-aminobutyrate hydrolase family protein [Bacteroidales bacterium]